MVLDLRELLLNGLGPATHSPDRRFSRAGERCRVHIQLPAFSAFQLPAFLAFQMFALSAMSALIAALIPRLIGVQSAERFTIQLTSGNPARLGKLFSGS